MVRKKIGALTIGQSPRPDLVSPLVQCLPVDCHVLQAGALDGLEATSLPLASLGSFPLTTRLRDGTTVIVEESYLVPKLQQALNLLEAQSVVATLLLCAGTFAELRGTRPLFKPFAICCGLLQSLGLQAIGLIAPIREQEIPIRQRWLKAGFQPTVWTADLTQPDAHFAQQLQSHIKTHNLECIVLDYVGHSVADVRQVQSMTRLPVIDVGQLAMTTLAGALR